MDKKQQLDLFLQRADELNNSRFLRTGFELKLEIKCEEGKGLTTEHTEPDKDDLKAFLLDFRHFVSNDEPVQMHKIYNLLYLTLTDAELKEALVQSREMSKTARKFAGINFQLHGMSCCSMRLTT